MILYHGTNTRTLAKLRKGEPLSPRYSGRARPSNYDIPSHPWCVYLTACYAPFYAAVSCTRGNDRPVVLEIEIDPDQSVLLPDEDFLEQATRATDGDVYGATMEARTRYYRDSLLHYRENPDAWRLSLDHLGNVAHLDVVAPGQIKRAVRLHSAGAAFMACDPCIVLANFRIMGTTHAALTRDLFNEAAAHPLVCKRYEFGEI